MSMTVMDLLDRPTYQYSEVDRLVGLNGGTARRWINGYRRDGKEYEPILRVRRSNSEWATWGEFVETRILAEYRDEAIPTSRLRESVAALRERFGVRYPLAYLRPYLRAEAGELTIPVQKDGHGDHGHRMVLRTGQLLLGVPSRAVINRATLSRDDSGREFASQLVPDADFPGIVVNPDRRGGEPTFTGRRVSIAMIAGMVAAGEQRNSLAVDYGLSLADIDAAVAYSDRYRLTA